MTEDTQRLVTDATAVPWWMFAVLLVLLWLAYRLAKSSVDYSQLDDPDYLDDRVEYEARIDPFADHPMSCKCYHHR